MCINAQSGEQIVRLKRSLQENQAKSRVGYAYGNRVSSCFALRRSLRRFCVHISRFCVGYIIVNTFKNLLKSVVTLIHDTICSSLRFYFMIADFSSKSSISEDLVDRYLWSRDASKCIFLSTTFIAVSDVHSSGMASRIFHSIPLACKRITSSVWNSVFHT